MATTTVTYLIDELRLQLGDTDATAYQYIDAWLEVALLMSIKSLQRWWNFKYLVNTSDEVYRNPSANFVIPEPPVIENADERAIILMASIIIKGGTLQNSAWNTASWRDAEIAYSNIEGSRMRQANLQSDWDELTSILKVPQKRLIGAYKSSLPGFKNNQYEYKD